MTPAHAGRVDRVRGWLAWTVLAAVLFLVPWPAASVEALYSRVLYPRIQSTLTTLSNLLPVAVLDVMILAALGAVVYRLTRLAHLTTRRGFLTAFWEGVRRGFRAAALVVIAFMVAWGGNYRRVPLESRVSPAEPALSVRALKLALNEANALAARVRPRASDLAEPSGWPATAAELAPHMNAALGTLNLPPLVTPGRPKISYLLTPFFTRAGVDGMVNPLALESLLNPTLLPFERPAVLAHEWAHLAGLADEAEASAVGWLACMQGPGDLAYSASVYLLLEGLAALPPSERNPMMTTLDPDVRADLAAVSRRVQQQRQPQVQRAASEVYDRYLKANRIEDGTASYSRALRLILAEPLRNALTTFRRSPA